MAEIQQRIARFQQGFGKNASQISRVFSKHTLWRSDLSSLCSVRGLWGGQSLT